MKKGLLLIFGLFLLAGCVDYEHTCPEDSKDECKQAVKQLASVCEHIPEVQQWRADYPDSVQEYDFLGKLFTPVDTHGFVMHRLAAEEFNNEYLQAETNREFFGMDNTGDAWWVMVYPRDRSWTTTNPEPPVLRVFINEQTRQCIPMRAYS